MACRTHSLLLAVRLTQCLLVMLQAWLGTKSSLSVLRIKDCAVLGGSIPIEWQSVSPSCTFPLLRSLIILACII